MSNNSFDIISEQLDIIGDKLEYKINIEKMALKINKYIPTNCPTCRLKNKNDIVEIFDINCLIIHYNSKDHIENSSVRL